MMKGPESVHEEVIAEHSNILELKYKLSEKIQTFVFKCATIWLLASSNWSLSSLALWRRAWAAANEILTYTIWTSLKLFAIIE